MLAGLVQGADDSHPLLKIDEAARLLRVGRSHAYEEYLNSGGTAGLAVLRFGTCMRVPKWALLEPALTGRVVRLCDAELQRWMSESFLGVLPGPPTAWRGGRRL